MAMVDCKECGNKISNMAKFCPLCGFVFSDTTLVIGKRLKLQTLVAQATIYVSLVSVILNALFMVNGQGSVDAFFPGKFGLILSSIVLTSALIWFFSIKILAWWRHG